MHSNKKRNPVCVDGFRTASMHTVVTVRHSAVLSSEKFSLRQIYTTLKGVSKTNRKHRNWKGRVRGEGVISQYHH